MHARLAFRALAAVALSALTASAVQAQASAQQAPQVSVTGVVYTQYQYTDAPVHTNNFEVTRAYVNALGRFANGITTRVKSAGAFATCATAFSSSTNRTTGRLPFLTNSRKSRSRFSLWVGMRKGFSVDRS